ncbi:MAG: tetratricopeptide repeat protein [bacterium]|nr:tetratricopeptide repeat protein [bacterium]
MAKARQSSITASSFGKPGQVAMVIYAFALVAYAIAALVPTARIWGINWWGYFPIWSIGIWLLLGCLLAVAAVRAADRGGSAAGDRDLSSKFYWIASLGTVGSIILASFLFPATTHFSGDGYQLLSRLADGRTISKDWDIGSTALIEWVNRIFDWNNGPGALRTYQVVSLVAGILATFGSILLIQRLQANRLQRLLFLLGMVTGGYLLLFFGHVENYGLLVALVLLYSLAGYLVAVNRLSIVWLIPLLAIALFLHLIAVSLIPSFLYLATRNSSLHARLEAIIAPRRRVVAIVATIVLAVVYFGIQQNLLFLQFALLPLLPDRFAVEGEWLFSPKHLIDMLNLVLLLSPMSLLLLIQRWGGEADNREATISRYLGLLVLGTLGMVFLMRSGIGMPRDWDLFAIAGPPLVLSTLVVLFRWGSDKRWLVPVIGLAISLNLLMLIPRLIVNVQGEIAVQHFRAYLDLDFLRGRNARKLLVNYYRETGKVMAAEREQSRAESDYPESHLSRQAATQLASGKYAEAASTYWRVIEMNPLYPDGWANLGATYMNLDKLDSAHHLLMIANQMNPNNQQIINNLGVASTKLQRLEEAERWIQRALAIDSNYWRAHGNYAYLRLRQGRVPEAIEYFRKVSTFEGVPGEYLRTMGDTLVSMNAPDQALELYRMALEIGLDSTKGTDLLNRYPQLRN